MGTSHRTAPTSYAGRHRSAHRDAPRVAGHDVVGPLARGGSGTVWSATDASGEPVAIKVVPAQDSEDALVELAVLSGLRDPHLVRVRESIALPSGEVALVMDLLTGGTVGELVRARGHLTTGEVVTVLSPIASTLARLHGVGVVHADVSPGNVLLDGDGRPFLADLGVARIAGEHASQVRGTDGFVAPEVLLGARPTAASDVHAMGALAWFCLTGTAPDPAAVRGRLADRVPGLPDALVAAVEGALRIRPEDRPGADELALALFESAPAQPLTLARGEDDVSLLTRRIRAAARSEPDPPRGGRGRARAAALVALAVAVALLVTAGVAWWAAGSEQRGASASARSTDRAAGDVRMAADAPERDLHGLVTALAAARARAWETGVAARLVEVDAPRSPAMARDTEVLAGVQRDGQRYVGLRFDVREAVLVTGHDGAVTVRTRIDTGAHVVRSPRGDEPRPATAAAPVLLDLVHTPSGWRVHEVRST